MKYIIVAILIVVLASASFGANRAIMEAAGNVMGYATANPQAIPVQAGQMNRFDYQVVPVPGEFKLSCESVDFYVDVLDRKGLSADQIRQVTDSISETVTTIDSERISVWVGAKKIPYGAYVIEIAPFKVEGTDRFRSESSSGRDYYSSRTGRSGGSDCDSFTYESSETLNVYHRISVSLKQQGEEGQGRKSIALPAAAYRPAGSVSIQTAGSFGRGEANEYYYRKHGRVYSDSSRSRTRTSFEKDEAYESAVATDNELPKQGVQGGSNLQTRLIAWFQKRGVITLTTPTGIGAITGTSAGRPAASPGGPTTAPVTIKVTVQ